VLVITDLATSSWVSGVWFLLWYLVEHLLYEHVETRVILDQLLKLFDDGVKVLGIFIDMLNHASEPFFVYSVICWEPIAHPEIVSDGSTLSFGGELQYL